MNIHVHKVTFDIKSYLCRWPFLKGFWTGKATYRKQAHEYYIRLEKPSHDYSGQYQD